MRLRSGVCGARHQHRRGALLVQSWAFLGGFLRHEGLVLPPRCRAQGMDLPLELPDSQGILLIRRAFSAILQEVNTVRLRS